MKTLGLLETDTLYPDLLEEYTSYGNMFRRFLTNLGAPLDYRFYHVLQGELPQEGECDAYLITGSKAGVYENQLWIPPLTQWIQQAYASQEKLIGVCFGHQLLAQALGGRAARSPKGWGIGVHTTQVAHRPLWLHDDHSHLRLIYSHRDQVEKLPPDARCLLTSDFCENAGFYIGTQVLSFQGHPEFSVDFLRRLLPRRRDCIGEQVYAEGMATLSQPTESDIAGHWILELIGL